MVSQQKSLRLILARHGNTFNSGDKIVYVGAKTDLPLTDAGHEQANHLGKYYASQHMAPIAIMCGGLTRQIETAHEIAKKLNFAPADIQCNITALDEIDYGPWEGLTEADILAAWPNEYTRWTQGGHWQDELFNETFTHRQQSLKSWLQAMINTYQDGDTVIAVSSNGIIRMILSLIPHLWHKITSENTMLTYKIKTGHFCELLITENEVTILSWNQGG